MSTLTSRLGLIKPAGSEDIDVGQLNLNSDALDLHPGTFICTSTTRPTSPYTGQVIFETDTGTMLVRNNSAWKPMASGGVTAKRHWRSMKRTSVLTIPASTTTAVPLAVATDDPGANSSITYVGLGVFSVEMAGLYQMQAVYTWKPGTTGVHTVQLLFGTAETSASSFAGSTTRWAAPAASDKLSLNLTCARWLTAGEKVQTNVLASVAGVLSGEEDWHNTFQMYLVSLT